jgi:DNA transformation protein
VTRPVSALRNLGPRSERAFARAGIDSAEALLALGADAAYRRLLQTGVRPHFGGYWALCLAIEDRPWQACDAAEKAALRARFEALKAETARSPLETELDRLGLPAGGTE